MNAPFLFSEICWRVLMVLFDEFWVVGCWKEVGSSDHVYWAEDDALPSLSICFVHCIDIFVGHVTILSMWFLSVFEIMIQGWFRSKIVRAEDDALPSLLICFVHCLVIFSGHVRILSMRFLSVYKIMMQGWFWSKIVCESLLLFH